MPFKNTTAAVKSVFSAPENVEVVLIGTLYKEQKLKPSILAEYTKVFDQPQTMSSNP